MLTPNGKRVGRPPKNEQKAETVEQEQTATPTPPESVESPEGAAMSAHMPQASPNRVGPTPQPRQAPMDPEVLAMLPVMQALKEERLAMMQAKQNGQAAPPQQMRARALNRYRASDYDPMIPRDKVTGKEAGTPGFIKRLVSAQNERGYEDSMKIQKREAFGYQIMRHSDGTEMRTQSGVWMEGPPESYADYTLAHSVEGAFDNTLGLEKMQQSVAGLQRAGGLKGSPLYVAPNHGVTRGNF